MATFAHLIKFKYYVNRNINYEQLTFCVVFVKCPQTGFSGVPEPAVPEEDAERHAQA